MKAIDGFVELMRKLFKTKSKSDLSARLMSLLFVSPKEISLEDLAKKTGYSLSSVSTNIKVLEATSRVKRLRKPGSKKVFFYMEKDFLKTFFKLMKDYKANNELLEKTLPEIINDLNKSKESSGELMIAKEYYAQVKCIDRIMKKVVKIVQEEAEKKC